MLLVVEFIPSPLYGEGNGKDENSWEQIGMLSSLAGTRYSGIQLVGSTEGSLMFSNSVSCFTAFPRIGSRLNPPQIPLTIALPG